MEPEFRKDIEDILMEMFLTLYNPSELETKVSDCFQQSSGERFGLSEVENERVVEDADYHRIVFVLWKGIRYMQETRRQVKLLSEIYGE